MFLISSFLQLRKLSSYVLTLIQDRPLFENVLICKDLIYSRLLDLEGIVWCPLVDILSLAFMDTQWWKSDVILSNGVTTH